MELERTRKQWQLDRDADFRKSLKSLSLSRGLTTSTILECTDLEYHRRSATMHYTACIFNPVAAPCNTLEPRVSSAVFDHAVVCHVFGGTRRPEQGFSSLEKICHRDFVVWRCCGERHDVTRTRLDTADVKHSAVTSGHATVPLRGGISSWLRRRG